MPSLSIELNINTENLENNIYYSFLVINSNANIESSIVPIVLTVSENGLLLGDLNQDEFLNIYDVIILIELILDNGDYMYYADLNQDSSIDVMDVVSLVSLILDF